MNNLLIFSLFFDKNVMYFVFDMLHDCYFPSLANKFLVQSSIFL